MRKPTVLFCDDQRRFRDQFMKDHEGNYHIITIDDTTKLMETIERLKDKPDIILLDLYFPGKYEKEEFERRRKLAEEKLVELEQKIEETNKFVLDAWEPSGIDILQTIREKYSRKEISVAIYTRKGLVLLDDDRLRRVEELEGHWLLKEKLSVRTEKVRIDRIVNNDKDIKRLTDDEKQIVYYRLVLAVSWLIIGLLTTRLVFDWSTFTGISISVVTSILTGLVAFILTTIFKTSNDTKK